MYASRQFSLKATQIDCKNIRWNRDTENRILIINNMFISDVEVIRISA